EDSGCGPVNEIDVEVPRVRVTFSVTLAGAPLPAFEGPAHHSGPSFELESPEHGRVQWFRIDEVDPESPKAVPREAIELDLVPGEYQVGHRSAPTPTPSSPSGRTTTTRCSAACASSPTGSTPRSTCRARAST